LPGLGRPGEGLRVRVGSGHPAGPDRGVPLPSPDHDAVRTHPGVPLPTGQRPRPGPRTRHTRRAPPLAVHPCEGGLTMSRLGSLATRPYRGQAGINVVGRRRVWFGVAAAVLLAAALSVALRGFSFGIEFRGGNEFHVPASVGTIAEVEAATAEALEGRGSG